MTAEIVIINRQGIALAADSAVTIGSKRVWKTANKLFSLGPINDIAIMVYNTGDFVGIPWEVVVKEFRDTVANKRFASVKDCEIAFFAYLNSEKFVPNKGPNDLNIFSILLSFVDQLVPLVTYSSLGELQQQLPEAIETLLKDYEPAKALDDFIPYELFRRQFKEDVAILCRDAFKYRLTKPFLDKVIRMLYDILHRKNESTFMSGVVFSGYGKSQMLPYMSHYIVDGKFEYLLKKEVKGQTRFWVQRRCDLNDDEEGSAYVFPFAQYDMFYLFMEGIAPRHLFWLNSMIEKILKERSKSLIEAYVSEAERLVEVKLQDAENAQFLDSLGDESEKFRRKTLVGPILSVIQALPKEEMAAMAEALVELTALRRKVGSNLETVGGPTDVAVISKGEGLIWLKRKHYFSPELNGDFAVRKRLRLAGDGNA